MGYQYQGNVFVQLFAAVFKGLKILFHFFSHLVVIFYRVLSYEIVRIGMFIYKHEYIRFGNVPTINVILLWCFLIIRLGCKHNLPIW